MKKVFIFAEGKDDQFFVKKINEVETLNYDVFEVGGIGNLIDEKQFIARVEAEIGELPNLSKSTIAIICDSDLCHDTRKTEIEKTLESAKKKYNCETASYLLPLQSNKENGELEDLVLKIAEEIDQLKILKQKSEEFAAEVKEYKNPKLSSSIIAFRAMLAAKADKNDPVNKIHHAIKTNKGIGCILTEEFFAHNLLSEIKEFLKNLSN